VLTFVVFETALSCTQVSSEKISHGLGLYLETSLGQEPWSPGRDRRDRREKGLILLSDLDRYLSTFQRGHGGGNSSASQL
jgi:hypothetical protein